MLFVFLNRLTEDQDVVQICKTEVKFFENAIYNTLECLGRIPQSKNMNGNSKSPKGVAMAVF